MIYHGFIMIYHVIYMKPIYKYLLKRSFTSQFIPATFQVLIVTCGYATILSRAVLNAYGYSSETKKKKYLPL